MSPMVIWSAFFKAFSSTISGEFLRPVICKTQYNHGQYWFTTYNQQWWIRIKYWTTFTYIDSFAKISMCTPNAMQCPILPRQFRNFKLYSEIIHNDHLYSLSAGSLLHIVSKSPNNDYYICLYSVKHGQKLLSRPVAIFSVTLERCQATVFVWMCWVWGAVISDFEIDVQYSVKGEGASGLLA